MKKNFIYSNIKFIHFFDKILLNKRREILRIINREILQEKIFDILDIGTTSDDKKIFSNFIIKNINKAKIFKSISDQKITSNFFRKKLQKSITKKFTRKEIYKFSSDLVISNATIEHVGSRKKQRKMINNVINLTKKKFIIITPNRLHPIEFHTLLPLIHLLPKNFYKIILKLIGMKFYANEKNLNLLSKNDLINLLDKKNVTFKIKYIKFLFFKSNLILIGKINN